MTSPSGRAGQPAEGQTATGWLSQVSVLNPAGLNWPRGVWFLDVAMVPVFILWAIGYEQYLISASFGLLFSALIDPGGSYGNRAWRTAVFGLIGAGVTAFGFEMGIRPHRPRRCSASWRRPVMLRRLSRSGPCPFCPAGRDGPRPRRL